MNWNCNSLAKDDFHRLRLLEVQNSVFDYDLISLCETSLNDQVDLPNEYFNDEYSFISANKPDNMRHGGVGLFYKKNLPLKIRNDLSFDECIVIEIKHGRKKIFFFSPFCIEAHLLITHHRNSLTLSLTLLTSITT